jgi:ABC-2 type transport system permease protein
MGQALGGATLALFQGILFLLLAPVAGISLSLPAIASVIAVMTLVAFALTSVGLTIAWRMQSIQGFHAIMNLILMPIWFLSGAFFPATGLPSWLAWFMRLNPLTYGMAALRNCFYWENPAVVGHLPSLLPSLIVTTLFAGGSFLLATVTAQRKVE